MKKINPTNPTNPTNPKQEGGKEMKQKINSHVAQSLLNILEGCHQMFKTSLVNGDTGDLYDYWSEMSYNHIIPLIDALRETLGGNPPPFRWGD